jgi:ATP-dependent Clp protease ATP-binding subunit ClpA
VSRLKSFWKALTTPSAGETLGFVESPDKFTPRAQQVLALARREADRLNHSFVGTEHLLLGLIKLGQGTAVTVLQRLGLDLETTRLEVEKQVGKGPEQTPNRPIPYTPRVKKVLALAAKEARALDHTYVGTEHILLGLLQEVDGVAARVLQNLGVDAEKTRQEILKELNPNFEDKAMDANPSDTPQKMEPPKPQRDSIDTTKRYDVYCTERNQQVVYRNALFKGTKSLLQKGQYRVFYEFLEIEQADGQTVFIARTSIIKLCEPGVTPKPEIVPGEKNPS